MAYDSLPPQPSHREAVVNGFVYVHQSLHKANARVARRGGRVTAVTPRHYLDFINHFVSWGKWKSTLVRTCTYTHISTYEHIQTQTYAHTKTLMHTHKHMHTCRYYYANTNIVALLQYVCTHTKQKKLIYYSHLHDIGYYFFYPC